MVESGWGRVINLTSIVGQTGSFGQINYAVSKGGLIAFTMSLAREVSRKGVTVNAVAPGFIGTDVTQAMPEAVLATVKAMTPVGRPGRPEEVAAAVLFSPVRRRAISPARLSLSTAARTCKADRSFVHNLPILLRQPLSATSDRSGRVTAFLTSSALRLHSRLRKEVGKPIFGRLGLGNRK